ncbi:hypothetical protein PG995_005089 [Apiospora arundinis]
MLIRQPHAQLEDLLGHQRSPSHNYINNTTTKHHSSWIPKAPPSPRKTPSTKPPATPPARTPPRRTHENTIRTPAANSISTSACPRAAGPGGAQQRQDAAQPSSLGYGSRAGAPPGEESRGLTEEDVGRHKELEGEAMVAGAGEGRVANAVEDKPGATGSEPDLLANLDRKKAEQAEKREAIKEGRRHGNHTEGIDPRYGGSEGLRDA